MSSSWMEFGVAGIEWDKSNREKCRKHGVLESIIEAMFAGPLAVFPDPLHSDTEERFKAIGRSGDGRGVLIVFTLRERGEAVAIRPISARSMHRKEMDHYEKAFAQAEER